MDSDKTERPGGQATFGNDDIHGGPLRLDLPPAAADDSAGLFFEEPLPGGSPGSGPDTGAFKATASGGHTAGGPAHAGGFIPGGGGSPAHAGGSGPCPPYGWCCSASRPEKPWRKRHPVLFWAGLIVLLLVLGNLAGYLLGDRFGPPKIAVVNIQGAIMGSRDVNDWIEQTRLDPTVKGVLLRVNSPGGGVGASQEIYYAVSRLAAVKPVVVSMGAVAASGGYYVSLPAKRIFAVPSTVTGSIGVKMSLTNMEDLMKTIGISSTTLTTGDLKDAGSPFREITPEERAYLQGIIDDMFNDFVSVVSLHRGLSRESVLTVADGRAITGRRALEYKLVDELGDVHDALAYLKKECDLSGTQVELVEGPEDDWGVWRKFFLSLVRESVGHTAAEPVFLY